MSTSDIGKTSPEQAQELAHLCRAGRLFDIEKWIAQGKSLDISAAAKRGKRMTLLELAVETGFHSLVELIAKSEPGQPAKNLALDDAVSSRRLDLIELLLANGADIKSVPLVDVLFTWDPKLIHYFLDHGADPLKGRPFAEAFSAKIRTTLRPFIEYKRAHPEAAAELQEQLDCALRHFCSKGDLKWVSLLMWAGGDPRSRGPCLEKEYTDDPECYTSALEEACYAGDVNVLKRLKPEAGRHDLGLLVRNAASLGRQETIKYILGIGADPNGKTNDSSSPLDSALWRLGFGPFNPYGGKRLTSKYDLSRAFDCIRELLAAGAVWSPDDDHVNSLRRDLLGCEPDVTIEVLRLFREHNACPAQQVHRLLGTPRINEHLKPVTNALLRLGIHLDAIRNSSGRGHRRRA
jgi:hypothetical protein